MKLEALNNSELKNIQGGSLADKYAILSIKYNGLSNGLSWQQIGQQIGAYKQNKYGRY